MQIKEKNDELRLKVLLVGPIPPPFGGIPFYVKTLFDAKFENIELSLFNTSLPTWVAPMNREGKMSYSSIVENGVWTGIKKVFYVSISYPNLLIKIIQTKPDIIQVFTCSYWGYWRNWFYVLEARFFRRKTIFHLLNAIDVFYNDLGEFGKFCLRRSFNSADVYILQSPGLKTWLDQYSLKSSCALWNGIDLNQINGYENNEKFIREKIPVGITLGVLGKNKGTYDILEAIYSLKLIGVSLRWIFVGNGDLEKFKAIAKSKGIEDMVLFTGPVEDTQKWNYYKMADFYCLPSYAEGQPISIIEAMAIGLPVIATCVGSIPEMFENNQSGLLVNPGNQKELQNAIKLLVLDSGLRQKMGAIAYQVALERYQISKLFLNLSNIYHNLVHE